MAASLTVNQVVELVQRDDSDDDLSDESLEDVNQDEEKLSLLLDSFDGGESFNKSFFKENAIRVLMPLVQTAKPSEDLDEQSQRFKAARLLSVTNINAGSLLMSECRVWLAMIEKRLAGKVSIRRPYYAEIHRCIPHDIFSAIKLVIRNASDAEFNEPSCYISGNKKAEVISFTSLFSLRKLLSLLSALSTREVDKFFSRTLTRGQRSGNRVKLLVEDTKDFGFFYKKNRAQLDIQFFYGEWNTDNFPRHNCTIKEVSP